MRPLGVSTDRSAALVDVSRRLIFDYRLVAAEDTLALLRQRVDGEMAAEHGQLWVEMLRCFVTEDPAAFERFDTASTTLETAVESHEERWGRDRWTRHVEAERRWMDAVIAGRQGNYLSAAWKARSARSRSADLESDFPSFEDPLLSLSLARVAVASVPRTFRFLLRILGFRGDTDAGLEQMERVASQSRTNRYPARVSRAIIDLALFNEREATTRKLRSLLEDTPNSLLSSYLLTFALIEGRQVEEADAVLERAHDLMSRRGYSRLDYLDYFRGYIQFVQGDFDAAQGAFAEYLARHPGNALRAQAMLYRGLATEMTAGWAEAASVYADVEAFRDFDTDRWAMRWAQQRAEQPMSAGDRELLLARTAFDAGRYDEAERRATSVWNGEVDMENQDDRAEAAYRLGRVYDIRGEDAMAVTFYDRAVDIRGDARSKWAPHALYYAGRIFLDRENRTAARHRLERAIDWPTPYDFSDGLEQMASRALDRLESGA
ncbi:hypothetical protein CRI94_00110 [Longibacter salinarum]|uniref:Uncharacterized protein n=2 Tax=Longibacter salinarum TaxID=1850348 RepID=A0A2A8D1Q4_9BACT|nr:hypothetical protein CRI94_00110 [Longibacter salinarum]